MSESTRIITGRLTEPSYTLPAWAQDQLHFTLWDRDEGPQQVIARTPLHGAEGRFQLELDADAALNLAMVGHREGPHHLISIGWSKALDPVLANLSWPNNWAEARDLSLNWDGTVTLVGYVEQLHLLEAGGLPLAVLEMAAHAAPFTYRHLPPLPLPPTGDRHGLHTDRHLEETGEHVYYLLAEAGQTLAAAAQDALVSSLKAVAFASLGEQAGGWHEIVNLPLILDEFTLIGP